MVDSSPKQINGRTYTFVINPKNRKDATVDAKTMIGLFGAAKAVGWIYEKDLLNGYSQEFVAAIESHLASASMSSFNINLALMSALTAKDVKEKKKNQSASGTDDSGADNDSDDGETGHGLSARAQRARDTQSSQYSREQDRKNKNKMLSMELNEKALARFSTDDSLVNDLKDPAQRTHTSYNSLREMPSDHNPKDIAIDASRDTILFPVNQQLVPVHISNVKAINSTQESEFNVVTIEFVTPTAKRSPPGSQPEHSFLRSLQYRSKGPALVEIFTRIRQMQTDFKAKLKAQASTAQLVDQPKLISMKNPTVMLRDVSSKPLISPAKGAKGRATGVLTAHNNGFKYMVADKQHGAFSVEFVYANIKSCYLKRADKTDNLIMVHFEFHSPILVKKDKTSKFMQFYVELIEETYDTSKGNGMNEREAEMIEEEQERKMAQQRRAWNDRFAEFAENVEHQWTNNNPELSLDFELPKKDFKFQGIVSKDQVDVFPTRNGASLIALEASPIPFVVSFADIEVVALERVGFGLREFDLVVVYKEFKTEPRMISSIPVTQIDMVRTILQDNNILFFETRMNTQWKTFLEEIRKDIVAFYEDGGWNEFVIDSEDEEDEDDDEDDEDEDYEGDGDDSGKRKLNKARYQDSDSDFELSESDEEASDDEYSSDDDEDDDDSSDDDFSDGEEWSDLAEEAEEEDRRSEKRSKVDNSDDDRRSSKKDKKSDKNGKKDKKRR
jgi:nucleosome binding factor SPN SPT16 subunit